MSRGDVLAMLIALEVGRYVVGRIRAAIEREAGQ